MLRSTALMTAHAFTLLSMTVASESPRGLGCTALAVDSAATVDSSSYAGMNADCAQCDGRVQYIEAREYEEGATRPVYANSGAAPRWIGHGRGSLYEPKEGEILTPELGRIPQVRKTFAYWESVLPLMNEKGLAIGESSCDGRLMNYAKGTAPAKDPRSGKAAMEGWIDITTLIQLALERCETARCGVKTMGSIAEEYGFMPMMNEWSLGVEVDGTPFFADGGEAVTLSDRTGEAWVFHIVGGVPGVTKSVWAAQRVPEGHAAFVANNFILGEFPDEPNNDYIFSDYIFSPSMHKAARVAGLWDGKGRLNFARTFAPDTVTALDSPTASPVPLYASIRTWRLLGLVAPNALAGVQLPMDPLTLPWSVKVENKMKNTDVFNLLSDMYEGTEFDLSLGALAGPFGNPFPREGGPSTGQIPRGISIARTTYSVVGQSRSGSSFPVFHFAADTPSASVYVPFYPSAGGAHASAYSTGTMKKFTRDSAWWAFDFVANWASMINWRNASKDSLLPLRAHLQHNLEIERADAEEAAHMSGAWADILSGFQKSAQQRTVDRWWKLADDLIVKYNDGFYNNVKTGVMGSGMGYPLWWAKEVGFNQDIHPIFVTRDSAFEEAYSGDATLAPPGFIAFSNPLPLVYDHSAGAWTPPSDVMSTSELPGASTSVQPLQLLMAGAVLFLGVVIGRVVERRSQQQANSQYVHLLG